LSRHSLSHQSLSLPDVNPLSPRFFQFRPRQDPRPVPFDWPRRPEQALPFSPSETKNSGRALDWFEPELFRRRAAASAAQTRCLRLS
ncbi:hypothetical protein Prudu_668S000200, partial [Prunus dulcis]